MIGQEYRELRVVHRWEKGEDQEEQVRVLECRGRRRLGGGIRRLGGHHRRSEAVFARRVGQVRRRANPDSAFSRPSSIPCL